MNQDLFHPPLIPAEQVGSSLPDWVAGDGVPALPAPSQRAACLPGDSRTTTFLVLPPAALCRPSMRGLLFPASPYRVEALLWASAAEHPGILTAFPFSLV